MRVAKDEYVERDEYDALMPALTDESVSDGLPPELAAEHAAAVADVALLREHIGLVGRTLAAPGPAPKPAPTPVPVPDRSVGVRPAGVRRRRLKVALGLAAATAAVSLVGGVSWLALEGGGGISGSSNDSDAAKGVAPGAENGPDSGDQKPGAYVPCARLIVEGTVNRVEPLPGGTRDRIVLDVTRYYKPRQGAEQVTFVMDTNVDPRLHPGDRTLIGIPKGKASPDLWSDNKADVARDRAFIERELRQGKGKGDDGKGATC